MSQTKDPELVKKIELASAELIYTACKNPRYSIRQKSTAPDKLDPSNPNYDPQLAEYLKTLPPEERKQVLDQLPNAEVTPTSTSPASRPFEQVINQLADRLEQKLEVPASDIRRIKFVNSYCLRYIDRAKSTQTAKAAVACATYGNYAPQCIEAIKLQRKLLSAVSSKTTPTGQTPTPVKVKNKDSKEFSTF